MACGLISVNCFALKQTKVILSCRAVFWLQQTLSFKDTSHFYFLELPAQVKTQKAKIDHLYSIFTVRYVSEYGKTFIYRVCVIDFLKFLGSLQPQVDIRCYIVKQIKKIFLFTLI